MLPKVQDDILQDFIVETQPSRTFRMNDDTKNIHGTVDGLQALKQAIFLILNTERYEWLIFSWNYGVEFHSLIGKPMDFCIPEIQRRIKEALLQDDRIKEVNAFYFAINQRNIQVDFTVTSIYGDFEVRQEVEV